MAITCYPVFSSWVAFVIDHNGNLAVQFKNNFTALYPWSNIGHVNAMLFAPSKGKYVDSFLRNVVYQPINPPCLQAQPIATACCPLHPTPATLTATITGPACNGSGSLTYSGGNWTGTINIAGPLGVDIWCDGVNWNALITAGTSTPYSGMATVISCNPLHLQVGSFIMDASVCSTGPTVALNVTE